MLHSYFYCIYILNRISYEQTLVLFNMYGYHGHINKVLCDFFILFIHVGGTPLAARWNNLFAFIDGGTDTGCSWKEYPLNYVALNGAAFNCVALNGVALNCVALNDVDFKLCCFKWSCINCVSLNGVTLNCVALYCVSFNDVALNFVFLNGVALNSFDLNEVAFNDVALNSAWNGVALNRITLHCVA